MKTLVIWPLRHLLQIGKKGLRATDFNVGRAAWRTFVQQRWRLEVRFADSIHDYIPVSERDVILSAARLGFKVYKFYFL